MVLIEDKKYACETCIKGHRSSTCKHTDRPLFEVKKKGRPVTQCEHCRELRKTKQVHVKCLCELKEEVGAPLAPAPSTSKKSSAAKVPANPAFPHGIPEGMEASVVLPSPSEASSDSDRPNERAPSCACKEGEECNCCTPRKRAPRKGKGTADAGGKSTSGEAREGAAASGSGGDTTPPLSVLARVAELRPVLPRPPSGDTGSGHSPSSTSPHGNTPRHHSHQNVLFSPYSRAYEQTSGEHLPSSSHSHSQSLSSTDLLPSQSLEQQFGGDAPFSSSYPDTAAAPADERQPSFLPNDFPLCGCGDGCTCPGCLQHNAASMPTDPDVYSQCTNPGPCGMCLECSILALSAGPPRGATDAGPGADSVYAEGQDIDEWIRRVSAPTSAADAFPLANPLPPSNSADLENAWQNFQMPSISEPPADVDFGAGAEPPAPELCGGRCSVCASGAGCCGRGAGCECEEELRRGITTFATSGERGTALPRSGSRSPNASAVPSFSGHGGGLHRPLMQPNAPGFLSVPGMYAGRSRSSSTSSLSSHPSSAYSGDSHGLRSRGAHSRHSSASYGSSANVSPSLPAGGDASGSAQYFDGNRTRGEGADVARGESRNDAGAQQSQYDPSLDAMQIY